MCGVRRTVAALAITGATLALALPVMARSSANEALSDFRISGPGQAQAGSMTFKAKNTSDGLHELVVLKTSTKAARLPRKNGRASEAGKVGEVEVKPGQAKTLELTLKPGHYVLLCNVGKHYQAGMYKDFTVS